ncbi:recombinase family protein [Pontiellaceae bacterium B12219]|nr:recombinase family protein [Pontiellaceae bacterium B12219]
MLNNVNTRKDGKPLRCAIYTRKSHEEGLEQEFNSLDAQRESAEAYIESQKLQGWQAIPTRYDDGGFSGGTMERPALKQLLADIDAGKVDLIVVYKIDRLSRSLLDFMKMIEVFNEKEVSFVSVTQHFSTTDPTGRMFLGILITFAQYEREVIGERIRDKVSAAKRRGKYCGGVPPLGYDVDRDKKKLMVNPEESRLVQRIFKRYVQLGSVQQLGKELNEQGYRTKSWTTKKGIERIGTEWNNGQLYRLLNNRLYLGEIAYKGKNYPAEHDAVIDQQVWDQAQALLSENQRAKRVKARVKTISPLSGVIRCGHCDCAMGITYTKKKDRRYSYYICMKDDKRPVSTCPIKRVSSGDIEKVVLEQLGAVFRTPTLVAKTYFTARDLENEERERLDAERLKLEEKLRTAQRGALALMSADSTDPEAFSQLTEANRLVGELSDQLAPIVARLNAMKSGAITEADVSAAFQSIEVFWEDLFPLERHRLIQLLVDRIELREEGIDMTLKTNGLTGLVSELSGLAEEVEGRTA